MSLRAICGELYAFWHLLRWPCDKPLLWLLFPWIVFIYYLVVNHSYKSVMNCLLMNCLLMNCCCINYLLLQNRLPQIQLFKAMYNYYIIFYVSEVQPWLSGHMHCLVAGVQSEGWLGKLMSKLMWLLTEFNFVQVIVRLQACFLLAGACPQFLATWPFP